MKVATSILILLLSLNVSGQTTCEFPVDNGPFTRLVTENEDHVVSGIYEAVAQRYNGVDATISSVSFWARTNPANSNGDSANMVTVKIFYINPSSGGINGAKITNAETSIRVDTSSTHVEYTATFSPAIPVNDTNIMVVLEPTSPGTDDFFVKRSTNGDGGGLKLILLKQGGMWFNNNSLGGGFDYDLQIFPNQEVTVQSAFTHMASGKDVTFTNSSTGALTYYWDFGDGDTSVSAAPMHTYATYDTFTVTLTAYAESAFCFHSSSTEVILVEPSGLSNIGRKAYRMFHDRDRSRVIIDAEGKATISVYSVTGQLVEAWNVQPGTNTFSVSRLLRGVYILSCPGMIAERLIVKQ